MWCKKFVENFKKFALKGNVIDLAVAVVIWTAFGKIVSSLVADIITPLIGIVLGWVDFTDLKYTIWASSITYGNFLQSIFDLFIKSNYFAKRNLWVQLRFLYLFFALDFSCDFLR